MRRDEFLSILPGVFGMPAQVSSKSQAAQTDFLIPPYLQKGDLIGICSPAGYVRMEEIEGAMVQLRAWGLELVIGESIGKRHGTFGGTDQERKEDLQQLIRNPQVKAIMCARGGYGLIRIVDEIDFTPLLHHPKWIIGFSDVTVLHSHFSGQVPIASVHAKMCTSFPEPGATADPEQLATIESIRQVLFNESFSYPVAPHPANRTGYAKAPLVGGNLKTLETLSGSKSAIDARGRILFLEDTGEYAYSVDRMLWNLKRSGVLDNLAGLVIGGFKIKPADPSTDEFGKDLVEMVLEKVQHLSYPVCFQFPVGHQRNNYALRCGVAHELRVEAHAVHLKPIRHT